MKNYIPDLTIAIPVRNEEQNLPGCLDAIGKNFAQKIVLIDSGSTDATVEIARKYNVEIIDFHWNGKFPKKRNWYLRNYPPLTKWILFLDADEYITEDFKNEVYESISKNDHTGYWLNYTVYFLGKQLKGGYPLKKLALFQIDAGEYEKIEEDHWSNLDMEIHEHPVLKGTIGTIRSKIDHQDFRGVSHSVKKHDEYASWEASRYFKTQAGEQRVNSWTWKQKVKYKMLGTVLIGPFFFLGSFILMGGFRDGSRGFAYAILKASYFTQIYCKIKEFRLIKNANKLRNQNLISNVND